MAGIGLIALTAASTAQNIQSSREQERVARSTAAFNKEVALKNARLSTERAEQEAKTARRDTSILIASQQATSAASGVVTTVGSPLLARMEQAREGELEALNILRRGEIEKIGFEEEASFRDFEERVAKVKGSNERTGFLLSGISQGILTGNRLKR